MPDKLAEVREQLSVANRILANEGVLDAFGHVSARHPTDSSRYLISRHRAAALVGPADILEFTLDSRPVRPTDARLYSELVVHGETYRLRPDVNSVCHHHSLSVMPFCITGIELVPVMPLAATLRGPVPFWDSRTEFGDTDLIISRPEEGRAMAEAMGDGWAVLLRRHGATVAGRSVQECVFRSVYMCRNAELQRRAMAMGALDPLSAGEIAKCVSHSLMPRMSGAWRYWAWRVEKAEYAAGIPNALARAAAQARPSRSIPSKLIYSLGLGRAKVRVRRR